MSELYKALIKAQSEIQKIIKNKKGYGYMYADLSSIIEATKSTLKANGIGVFQPITHHPTDASLVGIKTIIAHEGGETLESLMFLPKTEITKANDVQAIGASITYGRRYSYCAALGIAIDDDTDGVNDKRKLEQKHKDAIFQLKTQKELSDYYNEHKQKTCNHSELVLFLNNRKEEIKQAQERNK